MAATLLTGRSFTDTASLCQKSKKLRAKSLSRLVQKCPNISLMCQAFATSRDCLFKSSSFALLLQAGVLRFAYGIDSIRKMSGNMELVKDDVGIRQLGFYSGLERG